MLAHGHYASPEFIVKRIRHILVPLDGTSTAEQVREIGDSTSLCLSRTIGESTALGIELSTE